MTSINFLGKEPMQWWIGQVTDPKKGEWDNSLETYKSENSSSGEEASIYSHRCRVRIVGYHDNAEDLPDKDLPLAHVLMPANMSSTGGLGGTMRLQGGEVVVGFFADGTDAQQPIIFGTLFKQQTQGDQVSTGMFNSKNQVDFVPWTPPKVVQKMGKQVINKRSIPQSPAYRVLSADNTTQSKTVASQQASVDTDLMTLDRSPCDGNEQARISHAIKDFTDRMRAFQSITELNETVDPQFGGIVNMQEEMKLTQAKIHDATASIIRRTRAYTVKDTLDKLKETLAQVTPKPLAAPTGQATKQIVDAIFCHFENVQEALLDYLMGSLENMVDTMLDVPHCAIENFLGDMFGQVGNMLDSGLGNLFGSLGNITNGAIGGEGGMPSDLFKKGLEIADVIVQTLECDEMKCPEPTVFSARHGTSKGNVIDMGGIIDKINSIGPPFANPRAPDCSTDVLECGPPKIDFMGGNGTGASAKAVVNALGQVVGATVLNGGFGFTHPPLMTFVDSCDNGFGAGGYPVMGPVSPVANGNEVYAGGSGGTPLTIPTAEGTNIPIVAGGIGGTPVVSSNGDPIVTSDGDVVNVGAIDGVPVFAGGSGGTPVLGNIPNILPGLDPTTGNPASIITDPDTGKLVMVDSNGNPIGIVDTGDLIGVQVVVGGEGGLPLMVNGVPVNLAGYSITVGGDSDADKIYKSDPNGLEMGIVDIVIVDPGHNYMSTSTQDILLPILDDDGNPTVDSNGNTLNEIVTKEMKPDPNGSYDGETSYVTSLGDVVVQNTGFGYSDGDTATVSGTTAQGKDQTGGAEVDLTIVDGMIVKVSVSNGGSGFTGLPEIEINSDTGLGASLLPVLNFERVEDAKKFAETTQTAVITVIDCVQS